MGSNKNRMTHRHIGEWGSKARKEQANQKRQTHRNEDIEDSAQCDTPCMDTQHCRCYAPPAPSPPARGFKRRKKDTKRWCRGKVDREHVYELIEDKSFFGRRWQRHQCSGCQKFKYTRVN